MSSNNMMQWWRCQWHHEEGYMVRIADNPNMPDKPRMVAHINNNGYWYISTAIRSVHAPTAAEFMAHVQEAVIKTPFPKIDDSRWWTYWHHPQSRAVGWHEALQREQYTHVVYISADRYDVTVFATEQNRDAYKTQILDAIMGVTPTKG